jgi:hypothetical protein
LIIIHWNLHWYHLHCRCRSWIKISLYFREKNLRSKKKSDSQNIYIGRFDYHSLVKKVCLQTLGCLLKLLRPS